MGFQVFWINSWGTCGLIISTVIKWNTEKASEDGEKGTAGQNNEQNEIAKVTLNTDPT